MIRRSVRRWPLAAPIGAGVLWAACTESPPVGPDGLSESVAYHVADRSFYYHQGERIEIEPEPEYIIISSDEPAPVLRARQALSSLSLDVSDASSSVIPVAQHHLLRLRGATAAQVKDALDALRHDETFKFVSATYRSADQPHLLRPLNRLDVLFKNEVEAAQIDSLLKSLGARVVRPPYPDSGFFAYRIEYPQGTAPLEFANSLHEHELVEWTSGDVVSEATITANPTDPYFSLQFHLDNPIERNGIPVDINAVRAWTLTPGYNWIRVVVIDDGIDIGHASGDLVNNWTTGLSYDLVGQPGASDSPTSPYGHDMHGTAVAGIIAANHNNGTGGAGIAPNVQLIPVRMFRGVALPPGHPDKKVASSLQIADGINWAWQTGQAHVISNSWGGGAPNQAMTSAIQNALTLGRNGLGTVVVFAAGNTSNRDGGTAGGVIYPASLSSSTSVISVGAINRFGELTNYTPIPLFGPIDVVAPSGHYTGACIGEIVTTDRIGSAGCNDGPGGNVDYTSTFSGTSAAAPQVSGVAALLVSYLPNLTAAQVKVRIREFAVPWGPYPLGYGSGKLDAWQTLRGDPFPPPPPVELSAFIAGPDEITPTAVCTWVATVQGGTPPYAYEWRRNGAPVAWTDTYVGSMNGASSFQLQLTVTDDVLDSDQDFMTVTNTGFGECLSM